jgi:hypothetical protein
MNTKRIIPIALAGLALGGAATTATAAPTATTAASRHVEGKVVSVNRDARTFRLRDSQRGTFRIKVTRATTFDRLAGLGSLHKGSKSIEATIKRSNGSWVATHVERSGGGGNHNGADDNGADDNGSGGHGADDPAGHR